MDKLSHFTFHKILKRGMGDRIDMSKLSRERQLIVAFHGKDQDRVKMLSYPLHHDTKLAIAAYSGQWRRLDSHPMDTHTKNIVRAFSTRSIGLENKAMTDSKNRRNALVDETYENIHGKKVI